MKKLTTSFFVLFLVLGLLPVNFSKAAGLATRLKGHILLQVESNGEAWYINPNNEKRYYLGRPADAFQIMRDLGLGISNNDFDSFNGYAPVRLSGKILLKVEDSGKAFYVNPVDLKMHYLGRPADAFQIMRELGLGITNNDLDTIPEQLPKTTSSPTTGNQSSETKQYSQPSLIEVIKQWKPKVTKVVCSFDGLGSPSSYYGVDNIQQSGSGYLIKIVFRDNATGNIDETSYAIATNAHVVQTPPQKNISYYKSVSKPYSDLFTSSCDISFTDHETIYKSIAWVDGEPVTTPAGLGYIMDFQEYDGDPEGVDFAIIKIPNPDSYITQNVGSLESCKNVELGEKVIILGFPGIGSSEGITVTEGIISGEEKDYYVTSAKIDSGNSGGVAVSSDRNCFLGTPTAAILGQVESLGRILKTESVLEENNMVHTD